MAAGLKVKVHVPRSNIEQHHSAWVGGSILASLGTFGQMWVSKEQYREFGSALVHRMCSLLSAAGRPAAQLDLVQARSARHPNSYNMTYIMTEDYSRLLEDYCICHIIYNNLLLISII
eukprot:SAG22_NODE_1410_length_4481_cov_10.703788_2_plen_118_part_00